MSAILRRFLFGLGMAAWLAASTGWLAAPTAAEDWSEFRGPAGQGHSHARKLPLKWSDTENVTWKQKIPGEGWSSPVTYRDRIFLTSAIPTDDKPKGDYGLHAICLDAASGDILWNTLIFQQKSKKDASIHAKNGHASPTPVLFDNLLYVHFGHQGTACLDLDGQVKWKTQEIKYRPIHGNGGSPILTEEAVIFSCDGAATQMLVALDRHSGSLLWKTKRPTDYPRKFSFTTPTLVEYQGRKQVVSPGSGAVCCMDTLTGKEIWRVRYDGYSVIPRPVVGHGMVYLSTGFRKATVMAIRLGGEGDVTDTHVEWSESRGAPHTPSPLLVGEDLYMVSDKGIASCMNALTGEVYWQERVGGNYSSSPIYGAGRIYLQSEQGDGVVLKAGREFENLATNALGERTLASYAVDGEALLIRGQDHLFRIEAP